MANGSHYDRFLDADYVRRSRLGGCRVMSVRTRTEAATLAGHPYNGVDAWQRFDVQIVLAGDALLRQRFAQHRDEHDVDTAFRLPVPQDPEVSALLPPYPQRRRPIRVTETTAAGAVAVKVESRNNQRATIPQGCFVCFGAAASPFAYIDERIHRVTATVEDIDNATTMTLGIFPALQSALPANAVVDVYPNPMMLHSAQGGFGIVDYDRADRQLVAFTARNDVR